MTVEHSFSYYMRQNLLSEVLECAFGPDIWAAREKKKKRALCDLIYSILIKILWIYGVKSIWIPCNEQIICN